MCELIRRLPEKILEEPRVETHERIRERGAPQGIQPDNFSQRLILRAQLRRIPERLRPTNLRRRQDKEQSLHRQTFAVSVRTRLPPPFGEALDTNHLTNLL